MAKEKRSVFNRRVSKVNKDNKNVAASLNQLNDEIYSSTYGSDRNNEVNRLDTMFNNLLATNNDKLNKAVDGDFTSFIGKVLFTNDQRDQSMENTGKTIDDMFNARDGQLEAFMKDQYRNRLLKQADLHEIASQMNELASAISITRDAIISADVVSGLMSRTLTLVGVNDDDMREYLPQIEKIEEKFKLQEKTKEYIIPRSLEYGEYHMYCIEYAKIFQNFAREKDEIMSANRGYTESTFEGKTLYDIMQEKGNRDILDECVLESVSHMCVIDDNLSSKVKKELENNFKTEVTSNIDMYLKNITINNNEVPLCMLDEGVEAYKEYYETFIRDTMVTEDDKTHDFNSAMKDIDGGVLSFDKNGVKKREVKFDNIKDCYTKLIDPMHLIPIEIMNEVIGYYHMTDEDISPLSGILTSQVYYSNFDANPAENSILNTISENIVKAFDKKFLDKNAKFKKLIVESIHYYKLHNKKIKYQFIPKEHIVSFKINEDENGKGVSMLERSLFYAKLYLMLLLFKIMSIVLYSNDRRVNYIRTSGLEPNIANKVEDIIRRNQQRQLNIADMFSYTTLVNKIGQGNELYIPLGMSDVRGVETETLAGQDVQINTEIMEWLKEGAIVATDVPPMLLTQGKEAEFSKTVELNNNKFQGSTISKQLSYNPQITQMYQMVVRCASDIPERIIQAIRFNFVQPKSSNATITGDLINNHVTLEEFILTRYLGNDVDNEEYEEIVKLIKQGLAKFKLPMIDFTEIEKIIAEARIMGPDKKEARDIISNGSQDDGSDSSGEGSEE